MESRGVARPEDATDRPPLLEEAAPGTLLYGGARMALVDLEAGFWSLYQQLEGLVGRSLTEALMQQAGANGGASFARAFLGPAAAANGGGPARRDDAAQAFRDCVAAYQMAGFGRFEVVSLRWPIGRAVIRGTDTFESWMTARHDKQAASPACSYTAGVLVGFINAIAGRRDIVCVERRCQAQGAKECLFELLPAGTASEGRAIGVDPDPALSYQLNLLQILFERMPMGIAVFDQGLTLRRCNPTWADFVRRHQRTKHFRVVPGMPVRELLPGAEAQLTPVLRQVLNGQTVRQEAMRTEVRGTVSYWDVVFTPLVRSNAVVGLVFATSDATERVLAYQSLEQRVDERTHEIQRRRMVAEGLRETLGALNSDRSLEEILDLLVGQASRVLGTGAVAVYRLDPDAQRLYVQASRHLPDWYVENACFAVGEGVAGQAVQTLEPVACPDTATVPPVRYIDVQPAMRRRLSLLRDEFRAILAVPLVIKDEIYGSIGLFYREPREFDSEDIEMAVAFAHQAALAIENARLKAKVAESAVAAERSRLARDLHDAVTQTLFSASLIAEVLPRVWDRDEAQGRARLDELRQLTRGALAEMRTLLLELRPSALVEAALADILRHLCEAITGRSRVPVKLIVEGQRPLPPEVQVAFYRVAQEALNNVAKHSGATSAEVRVDFGPRLVRLCVSDNGRGFDRANTGPDHLGLGIMNERAEGVGARLSIESSPGQGARVTMTWDEGKVDESSGQR